MTCDAVFGVVEDTKQAPQANKFAARHCFVLQMFARLRPLVRLRGARSITTGADSTQLASAPPEGNATPFQVKLHPDSFRSYRCDVPELDVEVTKDQLITMYKQMQVVRRMEMAADSLYKAKLIRGFCHLAIGQVPCHHRYTVLRDSRLTGSSFCRPRARH